MPGVLPHMLWLLYTMIIITLLVAIVIVLGLVVSTTTILN